MAKKVLVRSRYRHVLARTTRDWARGIDGKPVEVNSFRQFIDYHAYMTPSEAAFLIDSDENGAYIDAGMTPLYYYPAGAPLILDDREGELAPPLGGAGLLSHNPKQSESARRVLAEAEAQLIAREAQAKTRAGDIVKSDAEKAAVEPPKSPRGAKPVKISNPDIAPDAELDAPPTFGPV